MDIEVVNRKKGEVKKEEEKGRGSIDTLPTAINEMHQKKRLKVFLLQLPMRVHRYDLKYR